MACCAVGARADAAEVDAALRAGDGLRALAKRFDGASKSALGRHRSTCLGLAAVEVSQERPSVSQDQPGAASADPDAPAVVEAKPAESFVGVAGRGVPEGADEDGGEIAASLARTRARATRPSAVPASSKVAPVTPTREATPATDDARVMAIADLMADGEYHGRKTARELAARWGCRRGIVQDAARAAALICNADHGEIEQHRQESLGRWLKLYEEALLGGDVKAAVAAQAGYDRAAGVVQPSSAKVQVNVLAAPAAAPVVRALTQLVYALCPAEADTLDAFLADVDEDRDKAKSDPLAWLERRRSTITVEAG